MASQGAFLGDLTLSGRTGVPYMCHSISNPIFGASRVIELFYEWQEKWRKDNKYYIGGVPFSCDLALYGENDGMPAIITVPKWFSYALKDICFTLQLSFWKV